MNSVRSVSGLVLAACLAAAPAWADNSQSAPSAPASAPAPQKQVDLSKTLYSPAQNAISAKQPEAPGASENKTPTLPPPEDLPGASQSTPLPEDNQMEQLDPDGIPIAISQKHSQNPNQSMIDEYLKQQKAMDEENKDWLLRSYEQKLQEHQAKSGDQSPNLYLELSSNKELARLAGLPYTGDAQTTNALRTNDSTQDNQDGTGLRKDDADSGSAAKPAKQMMSWGKSAPAGIAAPLPFALSSSFEDVVPVVSTSKIDEAQDASDLTTPGAISSRNDDPGSMNPDLTLDMLPGESPEHARTHQDADSAAELSLPMDSTLLHKNEATALTAPPLPQPVTLNNSPIASTPAALPMAPSAGQQPHYDPTAPVPVSQVPPPARPNIANPFDILNR